MTTWKYFFPGEGETPEDAHSFPKDTRIYGGAEHAAQIACERDFDCHDGWERGEGEFELGIICPNGEVHKFKAWHEPTVSHRVEAE